jgi:hypothetical protein
VGDRETNESEELGLSEKYVYGGGESITLL